MWPIVDNTIREELHTYRRVLHQNLRNLNMGDFGIMLAMYGPPLLDTYANIGFKTHTF
jgi:hypothetical protein